MHDEQSVSFFLLSAIDRRLLIPFCSKYKGSKIDWDVDECCQPLERPSHVNLRKDPVPLKKGSGNSVANRFHLLNLDEDDEGEVSPAFSSKKPVGIAA